MAPLKPLQDRLYEEIVARIKQDDSSVPVRERGWWYYARFEKGQDYPVHARRRDGDNTDALAIQRANAVGEPGEQILLDVNAMAAGKDYFNVRSEEHTSELQSLMRSSYAVFCLKKKNTTNKILDVVTLQPKKQL